LGESAFHRSSTLSKLILGSVASPVFHALATSPSTSSKLLTPNLTVFILPPRYVFPKIGQERINILETVECLDILEVPVISLAALVVISHNAHLFDHECQVVLPENSYRALSRRQPLAILECS